MALNPTPIGKAIADYLYSARFSGQPPSTLPQLETIWENVMTLIYNDIKANMDVLPIAHSGEELSTATGTPSTGADPQGGTVNSTVTTDTPIVGMGSVQ